MRMLGARAASALAVALGASALQAQPAAAPAAAAPAAAAPTAIEKSAMERAQREADGPRRRILEAAKVKAVVKPDPPAPLLPAPAATAPAPAPAERPPALATLQAAVEPVELPASGVAAVPTVARLEPVQPAVSLIALPAARIITLPPPRLLSKVDPELPARVQRRGARRTELLVDLTIAADGGVREVRLRSNADDELASSVRQALLQWRYEPQPVERPHTVQLVFDAN